MEFNIGDAGDLLDLEFAAEGRGCHDDLVAILKLLQGVRQLGALPGVTVSKLDHQPVHELSENLGIHILQVVFVPGHSGALGMHERERFYIWYKNGYYRQK